MRSAVHRIRWPKLALGMLLTAIVALSIHSVMLQVLNVAFPDLSIITPPYKFLIRVVAMLALIVFWQLAARNLAGSFLKRSAVLFLIVAMLTESLFRGPFMEGYCTTAWIFAFVSKIQSLLTLALSSAMVVAVAPWLSRVWQTVLAAFAITALAMFVANPLIGLAMGPVMQSISHLAPQSEWCVLPYGGNVLIPAYLTFTEPVVACLAAAALTWTRLSPSRGLRFLQFALMILAIKNQLLMPLAYAAFAKLPVLSALVSEGQFWLEALALALLTGITWEWGGATEERER